MERKRIFPNFNRENKWLGIIDYKSLVFIIAYTYILYMIVKNISISMEYKVMVICIFTIPVIGMFYANTKEDNVIYILWVIIKFCVSKKVYTYKIENVVNVDEYLKIPYKYKNRDKGV